MTNKRKQKTIIIWVAIIGGIILGYNQITQFLASWGLKEIWQVNLLLLAVFAVVTYLFPPYLSALIKGLK